MALFPGALPAAGAASPSSTLSAAGHTSLHNTGADEPRALGTKMGTGASTPTNHTFLKGNGTGTSAWGQVDLSSSDITGQLPATSIQAIYPVGCIYTEVTGVNPNTTFGFGTWTQFAEGEVLVGQLPSDPNFGSVLGQGGEVNHTLTTSEMPTHNHGVTDPGHTHGYANDRGLVSYAGGSNNAKDSSLGTLGSTTGSNTTGITTNNTGSGTSHNNLQPFIVVYFWRRTA